MSSSSGSKMSDDKADPAVRGSGSGVTVHVDVCLHDESKARASQIKKHILEFFEKRVTYFEDGLIDVTGDEVLSSHCTRVRAHVAGDGERVPFWKAKVVLHQYRLHSDVGVEQVGDSDNEASSTVACHQYLLPFVSFEGLWESLYFDSAIKDDLIAYAVTALLFSAKRVDPTIVACNRIVLLHGPPGTGKTTLCKALAQTLAIRMQAQYQHAQLVEVNSHSLFSKWFSESGKLVQRLFERIEDLATDGSCLVFVLIDEVESLAAARQTAMSGSEPSDAVRSVNALLTQLDRLSRFSNVMILATSNLTGAIDVAFMDRADIRQYIGPPSVKARYEILRSCVQELSRVNIVEALCDASADAAEAPSGKRGSCPAFCELQRSLPGLVQAAKSLDSGDRASCESLSSAADLKVDIPEAHKNASALLHCALVAKGLSGRSLRKLPFEAHSSLLASASEDDSADGGLPLTAFLDALAKASLKRKTS